MHQTNKQYNNALLNTIIIGANGVRCFALARFYGLRWLLEGFDVHAVYCGRASNIGRRLWL